MSTLSQFTGGSIKSIQRGTISIGDTSTSATATITSVDTSKTLLFPLGASLVNSINQSPYLTLTNATTITATRSGSSGVTVASYQVVEYY